jgi:hypothetical protein
LSLVVFDKSFTAKSHATNLSNSFLEPHEILFSNEANCVFDFVLNKYFHANAHTIIFQIFQPNVSVSNGHTLYHAAQPIAVLLNTHNISLAASAESFLDIASCNDLAI